MSSPTDIRFFADLAAYVRSHPADAARAYAQAAAKVRRVARLPRNRPHLAELAAVVRRLDQLAQLSAIPPRDFDGEEIHAFPDNGSVLQHDFDTLVQDMAAASADIGDDPLGDLALAARMQDLTRERSNAFSPAVRITPASAEVGKTVFSDQALVQYNVAGLTGTDNQIDLRKVREQPVVRWDGAMNEVMALTVVVREVSGGASGTFPTAKDGTGNPYSYRPYAHVVWGGSMGSPSEVYCDVGRGVQLTVPANFVYVSVGMDAPPPTYSSGSMMLSGQMGFFSTARQSPVLRSLYFDNLTAGGQGGAVIPSFATTIEAVIGGNAGEYFVVIQNTNGDTLGAFNTTQPQGRGNAMVLPSDAYSIGVKNNGSSTTSVTVVFGLSL